MSRKIIWILTGTIISYNAFASSGVESYYGYKTSIFVNVLVIDKNAYIEYCYVDFMGISNTRFDTLRYNKNFYVGKFSKIKTVKNSLVFSPGNIELKQGVPDNSFNRKRNLGYLQYVARHYKKRLKWTGAKLDEFEVRKWSNKNSIQKSTSDFRETISHANDSLYNYYTTGYCQKFNEIIIKDSKIFPKRYLESKDTAKIRKVWSLLSIGMPKQKNMIPYLVQFPFPIIGLAGLDINPIILAAPVVYPVTYLALIGSEKFVAGRLTARSTYRIVFMANNNSKYIVKVRNSKIIRYDYNYLLPFNFEKTVLNNMNN